MKKKLFYLVGFTFVICLSSLVHAMWEKEFVVGSTIFSCQATNKVLLERIILDQGAGQSCLIISLSENINEAIFKIGSDGELYVGALGQLKQFWIKDCHEKIKITQKREQGGNEPRDVFKGEKRKVNEVSLEVVEDSIISTIKKQKIRNREVTSMIDDDEMTHEEEIKIVLDFMRKNQSFDEVSIKERIDKLQVGESITAVFADNSQVRVTFDRLIKLISEDDRVFPVQQSKITDSKLISGIMAYNERVDEGGTKNSEGIKLESSGKEIKMLLDFITANEEERKKLLNNLSTFDHIELVSMLDYHSISFSSKKDFFDCRDKLIVKICNLLKEGDLTWFAAINSLLGNKKLRVQGVMREVLNEVIKPASLKRIFEKAKIKRYIFADKRNLVGYINDLGKMEVIDLTGESIIVRSNVWTINFSSDGTKVIVEYYRDGKKNEIIDLTTGKSIVVRSNVWTINFSSDGTKGIVEYLNSEKKEIIDLTTGKSIVVRDELRGMKLSPDGTKVIVEYYGDSKKNEVIDLATGKLIVVRNNILAMGFSPDSTKIWVADDREGEVIDLSTRESMIVKNNVKWMGLSPDSTKVKVEYYDGKGEIIDLTTGESIIVRSNVKNMVFSLNGTKVIVLSSDGKGEIIDLITGKPIFVQSHIGKIKFHSDSTKVIVLSSDGKGEAIDLATGESIIVRNNVEWMIFSSDGTKIMVKYCGADMKRKVIDLETGESIIVKDNVKKMEFSPDSTKIIILSKNDKMEILDLEDYDRGINFATFTPEQLLFIFNFRNDSDHLLKIDKNKAKEIWQSFAPEIQEKLKTDYFPNLSLFFN